EPAAAPLASGHGPELAAEVAEPLLVRAVDLGRERARPDPGDVRLRDADHPVDPGRADADPRAGAAGDRRRRGDERVRAVVDVEQRRVRALEEHALAVAERPVDQQGGVGDVRAEALREALVAGGQLLELDRLDAVDALQPDVLLRQGDLDLLAQDLRVEEILDADPEPERLVGVRRADAAPGGADLELPEPALARLVDRQVPRHDHVGVARQPDELARQAAALEVVELLDQDARVDHAAGADHALPAADDPRREVAELEGLAGDDDRVAGVRPAVVAADEVGVARQQVDDLALALVPPLRADDDGAWHGVSMTRGPSGAPEEGQAPGARPSC